MFLVEQFDNTIVFEERICFIHVLNEFDLSVIFTMGFDIYIELNGTLPFSNNQHTIFLHQ